MYVLRTRQPSVKNALMTSENDLWLSSLAGPRCDPISIVVVMFAGHDLLTAFIPFLPVDRHFRRTKIRLHGLLLFALRRAQAGTGGSDAIRRAQWYYLRPFLLILP
jgi:hypothetical protein